jgi:hypothetical protein
MQVLEIVEQILYKMYGGIFALPERSDFRPRNEYPYAANRKPRRSLHNIACSALFWKGKRSYTAKSCI